MRVDDTICMLADLPLDANIVINENGIYIDYNSKEIKSVYWYSSCFYAPIGWIMPIKNKGNEA